MSFIQSLTLTKQDKSKHSNPLTQKKSKLIERINEQIQLANNSAYAPLHKKRIKRDDGSTAVIEVHKKLKRWWHIGLDGKVELVIRNGNKPLELSKGKDAISLNSVAEVEPTLVALKQAVIDGELDELLLPNQVNR